MFPFISPSWEIISPCLLCMWTSDRKYQCRQKYKDSVHIHTSSLSCLFIDAKLRHFVPDYKYNRGGQKYNSVTYKFTWTCSCRPPSFFLLISSETVWESDVITSVWRIPVLDDLIAIIDIWWNALGFEDVMISDFPTLNGMLTCRVFAEIHEKSRNNAADHTVPANVLLTDKLEFPVEIQAQPT